MGGRNQSESVDGMSRIGWTEWTGICISDHNQGTASKYTRSRLPVEIAAKKDGFTKSDALKLERQIKKLPAKKKINFLTEKK